MPRKKTSKRKARGILKRNSKYTSKKPSSALRDKKMPMPIRQLQDDFEFRQKRTKQVLRQIEAEQDRDKLDKLYTKLDELHKPSRAAFQEGLFYHGPNFFMHGEELAKATQREKNRYRDTVISASKNLGPPSPPKRSDGFRKVRWGNDDEISPPQPPVRTWGQFALQTLGLGKGKGTKKQGKKRKAKGKSKSKSKSKAKS